MWCPGFSRIELAASLTKIARHAIVLFKSDTYLLLLFNFFPSHDDVINWKHFPRNWPFVWGIHRSPVNSPHKGQWRGALMFFFICAWINYWVNNREAGDLLRYRAHYDVTVMKRSETRSLKLEKQQQELSHSTPLPPLAHICVSELGQHFIR